MSKHDLIFYENRRTPEVVPQGAPGKKGGDGTAAGKVTKRRPATQLEEDMIAKGYWIRVSEYGKTPKDKDYKSSKKSGIRPQHN